MTDEEDQQEQAMPTDIRPGQWVTVKITKRPRSEGGVKTLIRLFEKDRTAQQERQRLSRARVVRGHVRGGRIWHDRPARIVVPQIAAGTSCKLFASLDVLRELASVGKCVEITPA